MSFNRAIKEQSLALEQSGTLDLMVPSPSGGVPVRLYFPSNPTLTSPVLLLLHGGAFVGGDAGSEHERCLWLAAEAGVVVVMPEYRRAPEHTYPAALDDCSVVLDWIRVDGARGVDATDERLLVLGGASAGGALAASLVLRHRADVPIAGLMLLCPVLDDRDGYASRSRFADTPVWDAPSNQLMWNLYLAGAQPDEFTSPARSTDLSTFPPTYIQVAELDPLRDEALVFAHRLLEAEVSVDLRVWARTCHVFDQAVPLAPVSRRSVDDQIAFVRSLLAQT